MFVALITKRNGGSGIGGADELFENVDGIWMRIGAERIDGEERGITFEDYSIMVFVVFYIEFCVFISEDGKYVVKGLNDFDGVRISRE